MGLGWRSRGHRAGARRHDPRRQPDRRQSGGRASSSNCRAATAEDDGSACGPPDGGDQDRRIGRWTRAPGFLVVEDEPDPALRAHGAAGGHEAFEAGTPRARLIEAGSSAAGSGHRRPGPARRRRRGPDPRPAQLVERAGDRALRARQRGEQDRRRWTRADDYLVKPSARASCWRGCARKAAADPRLPSADPCSVRAGERRSHAARRRARGGEKLHLTPIEYRLLTHLGRSPTG